MPHEPSAINLTPAEEAFFTTILNSGSSAASGGCRNIQTEGAPEQETPAASELDAAGAEFSENAIAKAFSAFHADHLRYCPALGYLEWSGTRWKRVPDVRVMELARPACAAAARGLPADLKGREGLARAIDSAKTVAAVHRLAQGDARHYLADANSFDSNTWLLNCPGGTVDLRTGELRPQAPGDFITKVAGATPDGSGCPRWRAFLFRTTGGDAALEAYLQRLVGYTLIGEPSEEMLAFLYGAGANGKSTFLSAIQYVLGEYATTAAAETFMETRHAQHPTDLAKLAGARLVVASEVSEGACWNEPRLKQLTGRDVISARFMHRDFFDFLPQFTLLIAGNNRPALNTVDEAWRRRLHLIPFNVTIPIEERDTELKAKLRAEANGIMTWAVQGCLEWQRDRLNPPAIVLDSTSSYLADEDILTQWIQECCTTTGLDIEDTSKRLYASFSRWRKDRGESVPTTTMFGRKLVKAGFRSGQSSTGARARVYIGLCLTKAEASIVDASQASETRLFTRQGTGE